MQIQAVLQAEEAPQEVRVNNGETKKRQDRQKDNQEESRR